SSPRRDRRGRRPRRSARPGTLGRGRDVPGPTRTGRSSVTDSVISIAAAVRAGERSAVDVVDEYLGRVEADDDRVKAFNHVTADAAREAAAAVDAAVAAGDDPGVLAGVPI